MVRRVIAAALLACFTAAGCGWVGPNSQVDGWSIGEVSLCAPRAPQCAEIVAAATERLAARDPSHLPIIKATVHEEGLYPDGDGELGQLFRSGGFPNVVLFQLADGSHRAIGVRYSMIGGQEIPLTYDHGPERRPGRGGGGAPGPTN